MADRIGQHLPATPKNRLKAENGQLAGYFYPGEVAELLVIKEIDYHQLRRFYLLIRRQVGHTPSQGWSRFTFTDLACLLVALDLSGGPLALMPGRRLTLSNLDSVCQSLRNQGLPNPLLSVRMVRRGRSILADLDGVLLDPLSGQQLFDQVSQAADEYFDHFLLKDKDLAKALNDEIRQHRRLSVFDQNGKIRTSRSRPTKPPTKSDEILPQEQNLNVG